MHLSGYMHYSASKAKSKFSISLYSINMPRYSLGTRLINIHPNRP